jgi:acyl-CoA synthetase (AMP-forming)/AMP-acid ligase II
MLAQLLRTRALELGQQPFLIGTERRLTFGDALEESVTVAAFLSSQAPGTVFLRGADSAHLAVFLLACDMADRRSCIISEESTLAEAERIIDNLGGGLFITDEPQTQGRDTATFREILDVPRSTAALSQESGTAGIAVLTSGTTGTPKAALYTWEHLLGQARVIEGESDAVWLLAYPLNHFAGLQMLIHTLVNASTLVLPPSRTFSDLLGSIVAHRVDSVSATPTFWRNFAGRLDAETARTTPIRRITLGGEATTSDILEHLHGLFPDATITQVYATTELGSCFSVKDGKPGFPAEYLDRPVGNVALRIIDGQLFVKVSKGMVGYADDSHRVEREGDWLATGDLVEHAGERVFFRGRTTGIINVGGVKVYPLKVEELALSVPGVRAARVYGKPNPIAGQIVALDLEVDEGFAADQVIAEIRRTAQSGLSRYEQPRDIQVATLETRNEKIVRREAR